MISVTIPLVSLLTVILCKKIPKIGGNLFIALIGAGILSLLLGGIYNPAEWLHAFISGLDRIAWVICLSVTGSIYAETQVELGAAGTIMATLQARFRSSPKALVICVVLVLVVAGSLLGDAVAAATVIGVLTIGTLRKIGLSGPVIAAIILMGACMGSIMPSMTQALALSSALVGTDPDPVFKIGYLSVGSVIVLTCTYIRFFLLRGLQPITLDSDKKAMRILAENWVTLVPLIALVLVVLLRTVDSPVKMDLMTEALDAVPLGSTTLLQALRNVPVVAGLTNGIVLCIIFAMAVAFCFPRVFRKRASILRTGLANVRTTVGVQMCAGFILGAFYAGGQIETVQTFAQSLNPDLLKFGGAAAMCLIGMLTGSQTTAQNVVFSFMGPALVASGMSATYAAVAGGHIATAAQGLPPANLTAFVVAGIVGGAIGEKVDPIESTIHSLPMCFFMAGAGMIMMYL